ncbi:MAG TPA: hypothetical protein VFY23_02265 [Candidatus Limnocylindrales bacterium]|nr:hypothetical protein [Candidatus Limnocylindrales bacterium]
MPSWLAEVPSRRVLEPDLETRFALQPGDRPLLADGAPVTRGEAILERLRDRRVAEVVIPASARDGVEAGQRWAPAAPAGRRRPEHPTDGELLAPVPGSKDKWRTVTADQRDIVPSPVTGVVSAVVPGAEIRVRAAGLALRGSFAAGSPAEGRLELATDPFGELRPGGIDVGRAGSILVVGARIDAEALTRARAMGVRGIVVASLPGKELRDFQASERRQRAALHPLPPFGVLVLEGATRRRIPGPIAALFERLAGRDVSLLVDPPALVFEAAADELPAVDPDWVHVRSGPNAGAEGRVLGVVGLRRFPANVWLEAACVAIDGEAPVDLPLGDLERFV